MEQVMSNLDCRRMEMNKIEQSINSLDKDMPSDTKDTSLSPHNVKINNFTRTLDNIDSRVEQIDAHQEQIQIWTTQLTKFELDSHDIAQRMDEIESRINKVKDIQANAHQINDKTEYMPIQHHKTENFESEINRKPTAKFMHKHDIHDDAQGRSPILTLFQFMYPKSNYHPREVESYKFSKAKIAVICPNEDSIFTFYKSLRHIASSFNILLKPLEGITKETGICQLTPDNCIGYEEAYNTMATALHLKLTTNNYFNNFQIAQTYINAAANNSDGFKLLYRIVEIIHPQHRAAKGGIHKAITAPSYADIEDDNIYTFMSKYKNYLIYESLSPENRQYNKQEQTMYIVNTLKQDDRFKSGLDYVLSTLLSYQRNRRGNPDLPYPLDLEIDEIAVTIDEHSTEYTVGDQKNTITSLSNPFATSLVVRVAKGKPWWGSKSEPRDNEKNTQTCKACMGHGHFITNNDTICYAVAKAQLCANYMEKPENSKIVKSNLYRYKKKLKERASLKRFTTKVNGLVRKLEEGGEQTSALPIINLAKALTNNDDDSLSNCSSNSSSIE